MLKTHCRRGHEFTPKNTGRRKRGAYLVRYCKRCEYAGNKRRYEANPDKYRKYTREYYRANKERISAREKEVRQTDEARAIRRVKYQANRKQIRAYANNWQNEAYRNDPAYRQMKLAACKARYERDREVILEKERTKRRLNIDGAGDKARAQKKRYYYANQGQVVEHAKRYYYANADRVKKRARARGRRYCDTVDDRYVIKRMTALGYPKELMTDDAIEVFKLTLQLRRHIGATAHGKRQRIEA